MAVYFGGGGGGSNGALKGVWFWLFFVGMLTKLLEISLV